MPEVQSDPTPTETPFVLVDALHGAKFSKQPKDKPTISADGTKLSLVFRHGRDLHAITIHSDSGFKVSRRKAVKKVTTTYEDAPANVG